MLTRCTKCVLPETYPKIRFNDSGECNYCTGFKKDLLFRNYGEEELLKILRKHKNPKSKYDCLLALSGGRDSTFAAYYVVKKLNLHVLAVTANTGLMPEQTLQNIKNTVQILNIDHVMLKHNYIAPMAKHLVQAFLHKPDPAMIGLLCTGCERGLIDVFNKAAIAHQNTLLISGGGEPETSFAELLLKKSALGNEKFAQIFGFLRICLNNPRIFLKREAASSFLAEYYYRFFKFSRKISNYFYLHLFKYIPWDETEIVTTIQDKLNWRSPVTNITWRSDCVMAQLKEYFYFNTLGFTKHVEILSNQIRGGLITREIALERLKKEEVFSPEIINNCFSTLGIDPHIMRSKERGDP